MKPAAVLESGWGLRAADTAPLGAGHINDTLLVTTVDGRRLVLQRINERVFADPGLVMGNLERVLDHLDANAPGLTPPLIRTGTGTPAWRDPEDGWWRLWGYVPDSRSFDRTTDPAICESAARTFGRFQALLEDLPGPPLEPTIPGFLELAGYLARFDALCASSPDADRVLSAATADPVFIDAHRSLAAVLPRDRAVIHGDCKLNNLLFEAGGPGVVAVLDLDTVMTGHWAWDFGDLARSVLMGALEENDRSREGTFVALFAALARGFAAGRGTALDARIMATAPVYVAFMLGIRFLTDHLEGDRYFRVAARGDNLDRARAQFELVRQLPVEAFAASVR